MESEAILSTVANHARSKDVRTAALKMLHRKGSFTELIDKIREIECIRLSEKFFKERHEPSEQVNIAPVSADFPLNTQQYRRQYVNGPPFHQRGKSRSAPGRQVSHPSNQRFIRNVKPPYTEPRNPRGTRCWRCTNVYHDPSACHAIDKICHNCGREGHIRIACKTRVQVRTKREGEYEMPSLDVPP